MNTFNTSADWSYQASMIADVLSAVRANITHKPSPDKGCVLAGTVSSGKTRMALLTIDQLLKDGTVKNVLISAHGQTVIRSQMAEEAAKLKAEGLISFTFDTYTESKQFQAQQDPPQVVITLPHTVSRLRHMSLFDLVVVDEAHEFYFAKDGMLQRTIKDCRALYTIFLTGTPSKFIADGKFPIVAAASVLDLLHHNVVTSPAIRLAQSSYDFTQADYNANDNLGEKVKETPEQTRATMDDVLSIIHRELASRFRTSPRVNQALNVFDLQNLKKILPSLGKSMFACHSIRQARQVRDYFESKGINVVLSTSDDGKDAGKLADFSTDPKLLVLIVVRRGILGFNCESLVNLVDLTCTQNVDRLFQLFGRILRLHPQGKEKLFLKVVPHKLAEYNYHLMNFVLSLCDHDRYVSYEGEVATTPFRTKAFDKTGNKSASPYKANKRTKEPRESVPVWEWDLNLMERLYTKADELLSDYAQTTLRKVQISLGNFMERKSPQEWVPVAEKLALENGGLLQGSVWLRENGYIALYGTMLRFPDLFSHIPRENGSGKNPHEWVPVAEKLALENDGTLPGMGWLKNNGYGGLKQAIRNHPELFSHLKQDKVFRSLQEWVQVAEKLAAENNGVLPNTGVIQGNKLHGLDQALRKYPDLFSHIPRGGKGLSKFVGNSPEEWVPIAEKLALKSDGRLPGPRWLCDNGYSGLDSALRKRPELFAHIPRAVKGKKVPVPELVGAA